MGRKLWTLVKDSIAAFMADEALSRGAAIAFYTVTSIAPVLVIVIAIAGLAFGQEAARGAIAAQLSGLMGQQSAEVIQSAIENASGKTSGTLATVLGVVTLLVTASGVFGEMQTTLNAFWKVKPKGTTVSRLVRARAASLGLVAALGFLLLTSLVVSAGISALGDWISAYLPLGDVILEIINIVISFTLIGVLFAAIYKILPDVKLRWRDVIVGAAATSFLFTIGKSLIGIYLGSSAVSTSFGAASSLLIILLWVYYSVQIFLLGAEFTKVYASTHGSQVHRVTDVVQEPAPIGGGQPDQVALPRPRPHPQATHTGPAMKLAWAGFTIFYLVRTVIRVCLRR